MSRERTEFHRHETTEGVLTWLVTVDSTSSSEPRYARPRGFELDGEPLTVQEGRELKLRHQILD